MKRGATLMLSLAPLAVWAQDATFAGTKKDIISAPVRTTGSTMGILPLLQLLAALAIVFVLIKYLLPKIASKVGKRLNTKLDSAIKIEESASFGGGMLYIVEAKKRTLLLAVGAQGISCLADLTEGKSDVKDSLPLFSEMLSEQPAESETSFKAAVEVVEDPEVDEQPQEPSKPNAQAALETLRRFAG
jgi:flagellar biogenesis protein FliO